MSKPQVSIICITYNHVRFIRDALEGFINQKTDFKFEILIHDDASTDGTAEVVREYMGKYPELIRGVLQKENIWSKGNKDALIDFLFPMVQGKYVALNEGDDFWTDEHKLQKQFDFMESHPDATLCFHPVKVCWDDNSHPDSIFPPATYRFNKDILSLEDLLDHNFIQTNSVMYRWRFHKDPLKLIPRNILPGDWFLHLLHAQIGKIYFMPDIMAVYRRHTGSVWCDAGVSAKWFQQSGIANVRFFLAVEKYFGKNCSCELKRLSTLTALCLKKAQQTEKMHELKELYPQTDCAPKHIKLKLTLCKLLQAITFVHTWRKSLKRYRNFLEDILRLSAM